MKRNYQTLSQEERFILIIDKFINNMKNSGFGETEITYHAYTFCAGYHIKHYVYPTEQFRIANINGVVDMLYRMLDFFDGSLDLRLSNKKNMLFFLSEVVDMISCNKEFTEIRYLEIQAAYEKSLLRGNSKSRKIPGARTLRL